MLLFVYTPCGRAHRARHTAASVQPLDGYTCQGTPCLMDGPQMKPCTSLGGSSWHLSTPLDSSTARQSRQSRQLSTQRSAEPPSTVSTVSTVLSSCQARQSLDSCRQLSTVVDTCRQSRQSRQPGLSFGWYTISHGGGGLRLCLAAPFIYLLSLLKIECFWANIHAVAAL
jgi:hypothetical protein